MAAGGLRFKIMKREYFSPKITIVEIGDSSILCTSSPVLKTTAPSISTTSTTTNVYSSLTQRQKLAAMNLMKVFGSTCPCIPQNLDKIDHIMSVEAGKMEVSSAQIREAWDTFSGMPDMVNTLKGANRCALESLFWAYYCIVAVGKSAQAVQVLLGVYGQLGFSEHECLSILENRTGRKFEDL